MNGYATSLTADLRAAGYAAEAPWPTGGGCEQIFVPAGDIEIGITNGDAALPDGEPFDGAIAFISARDADGDQLDSISVAQGESVVESVNLLIGRLT